MSISSLGVGSSILTQDVLDQLRAADEAGQVTPITLSIANENDKKNALEVIDASMKNLIDSINEIKTNSLFDERSTDVSGSAVSITADANSDIQDFTLSVNVLATKQIEESGQFSSEDELVGDGPGNINLNIDGEDFLIPYDATTTLKELKASINEIAGDKVDATIVNLNTGDSRLFISSANTGATQNITMSDLSGNLKNANGTPDTRLTSGMAVIQPAVDAELTFNGQAITRSSNSFDDLITGLDIDLKELGTSVVSVNQNRDNIMSKFDSFISHYNSAITELGKMTKASAENGQAGIFSGESTIKNMKRTIEGMLASIGGGVGSIINYGFDVDKDGKLTLDKTVMNDMIDDNAANVEAFFSGGTFVNADNSETEVDGAFTEFSEKVEEYTKYNATLDLFKTSINENISSLEDRKESATQRLDSRYDIMKKQWAAYDLMINRFNSASSMFTEMSNAQTSSY